ncbi:pyridoxal-phosphate dependent enzyme, partial [bacterium]|nr:pyridoxal-phosphate dependent enzyme [bacterium]
RRGGGGRGLAGLKKRGLIERAPYVVGVQAAACSPLVAAFERGLPAMEEIVEGSTLAEGVRVRRPVRAGALLREVRPGDGTFLAIAEEKIQPATGELARRGMYVEPTSALVWAAFSQLSGKIPEPVILILSGSGFKVQPSI